MMELRQIVPKVKGKKGMALGDMYGAVLMIVLVGIVLGIGLYVLSETEGSIDNDDAGTAINDTITGLTGFADWIAVIVVVIAAAIVLGVVMRSFGQGAKP